jgi:hypothetical protein
MDGKGLGQMLKRAGWLQDKSDEMSALKSGNFEDVQDGTIGDRRVRVPRDAKLLGMKNTQVPRGGDYAGKTIE